MQQVAAGPARADVYRRYRFRVFCDGRLVAGVSQVSLLRAVADGETGAAGATLSLRRGLTRDRDFERWAEQALAGPADALVADGVPRNEATGELLGPAVRDLVIDCHDETGRKVTTYRVHRCQPAALVARQASGGDGDLVAIQSLTVRAEAWERELLVG